MEKSDRPLNNLFQFMTTFLVQSLFLVSSWILVQFGID